MTERVRSTKDHGLSNLTWHPNPGAWERGWLGAMIRHWISQRFRKRPPERKLATRSDMQRLVEHFNKRST